MHGVPGLKLQVGVFLKQRLVMPSTVDHVVTASHDAENTTQALITQRVGVMRFLPSLSNGGENFFGKQIMDRQPFVPGVNRVADPHLAECLAFSSAW